MHNDQATTIRWRRWITSALALAAPVTVLLVHATLRDEVPDPLPTHWSVDGTVDNTASAASFFTVSILLAGALALVTIAAVWWAHSPIAGRMLAAVASFGAGIAGAAYVATMAASRGASSAPDVDVRWYDILGVVLVPAILGVATWALAPGRWTHPDQPVASPNSMLEFAPGEKVVWVDHAHSTTLRWACAVMVLVGAVLCYVAWPVGIIVVVVAVALVTTSELAVVVDARGVRTLWGPFGWPRGRIPLATVTAVHAEEIRPMQWGGWGYRVSSRGVAAIIRRGPGLVVERGDKPPYAVTVPHANDGAAVLDALLRREHGVTPTTGVGDS